MSRITVLTVLLALCLSCATKKHVRMQVDPINQRVGQLEAKSKQTDASIGDLERGVSRADEQAKAADNRAKEAAEAASKANENALKSGEQALAAQSAANGARTVAEKGLTRVSEVDTNVNARITGLENFQLTSTETVLFGLGQSKLTDDARQRLGDAVARLREYRRYVIEIQGFTDKTGPQDYNLELSRKRANEVVRFLTVEHKVPLYRIHVLGVGSAMPVADDRTSQGRRQNRRVEVKVYTADQTATTGKLTSSLAADR